MTQSNTINQYQYTKQQHYGPCLSSQLKGKKECFPCFQNCQILGLADRRADDMKQKVL